jgi:hypothetical protein
LDITGARRHAQYTASVRKTKDPVQHQVKQLLSYTISLDKPMRPHYDNLSGILRGRPSRRVAERGLRNWLPKVICRPDQLFAIQQPQKAQLSLLPWRNWLARSTVRSVSALSSYREVDSSSLSGRALFLDFFPNKTRSTRRNGDHMGYALAFDDAQQSDKPTDCVTAGRSTIQVLHRPSCCGHDPVSNDH